VYRKKHEEKKNIAFSHSIESYASKRPIINHMMNKCEGDFLRSSSRLNQEGTTFPT